MWALALSCEGQVRVSAGRVLGFDMGAVLAMAEALGVDRTAVALLMPRVEASLVRAVAKSSPGPDAALGDIID